jgi:predicted phosphodiesterase
VCSNAHALKALIGQAEAAGIPPENAICTGDVVSYCADAARSVDMIRDWGCPVLKGNCENQLATDADDCGCGFDEGSKCSLMAVNWYAHARRALSQEQKQWLGSRPDRIVFRHNGFRCAVVHGGASDISKFLWPVTENAIFRQEINLLKKELGSIDRVVSGHSGVAFWTDIDGVTWINAGSVGMPDNSGTPQTIYTILSGKEIKFKRLEYDFKQQSEAMRRVGLTQGYEACLVSGDWPSEEILPLEMRRR